jgi:hypothetical protein
VLTHLIEKVKLTALVLVKDHVPTLKEQLFLLRKGIELTYLMRQVLKGEVEQIWVLEN